MTLQTGILLCKIKDVIIHKNATEEEPPLSPTVLPEFLADPLPTVEEARRMGRDYARNGANETNCHFRLFATPEHLCAWEQGKADAQSRK